MAVSLAYCATQKSVRPSLRCAINCAVFNLNKTTLSMRVGAKKMASREVFVFYNSVTMS